MEGPSVTNTIEQLAAEVLLLMVFRELLGQEEEPIATRTGEQRAAEVLRERVGEDGSRAPCVLIEHYPDRQWRARARYHDDLYEETFSLVTLPNWLPQREYRTWRGEYWTLKRGADWHYVKRAEIERLVGGTLDWPACTCEIR